MGVQNYGASGQSLAAPSLSSWAAAVSDAFNDSDVTVDARIATATAPLTAGVFTPEQYGAVGDGIADDTTAVTAAFTAANAVKKVSGTYADPGATVRLAGTYNLTTLAAPIDVMCNVVSVGAFFYTPAGYTGTAVRVGHTTSGSVLQNADITLPSVIGASVGSLAALPAGSIGVQIRNLYTSNVTVGKVVYFETCLHVGGESWGVAYNRLAWRTLSYGKVLVRLRAINAGGWVNQNVFMAGSCSGSPAWGARVAGTRGVVLDGSTGYTVNCNTFVGTSLEGDVYEHAIEFIGAIQNCFVGTRFEQAAIHKTFTVSGATLTSVAHGLSVGMCIATFTAGTLPGGMTLGIAYYVIATPTADTFTIGLEKAGTAVTFTSAGSGMEFFRPSSIKYDGSSTYARENVIDTPYVGWNGFLDKQFSGTAANTVGNQVRYASGESVTDSFSYPDVPLHKARNANTGAVARPIWGAYPPGVNPITDPEGWSAALSDRGLLLSTDGGGGERVRIHTHASDPAGVIYARRPADSISYEIPTALRMPGGTLAITALSCAANTTTTQTMTLTGATYGDYVLPNIVEALPAGVILAGSRVSAANTVTLVFANLTSGAIDVTCSAHACVFRQYY